MPIILLLATVAHAAEVVWLEVPADPSAIERVAVAAGATRNPLRDIDLRAAATDAGPADDAAYKALAETLHSLRQYETQLDGELLIIDELSGPLAKVSLVRNGDDRGALFAALAYQGFAVDRFFADQLAKDSRAVPYRVVYEGLAVEGPWADAVAIEPDREVTPYEIAEAPQRVDYGEIMKIVKRQLPGRLVPGELPAGATLRADGRDVVVGPSGTINVGPGRHLVDAELSGHVIARWDVRVGAGEKVDLPAPISDAVFTAFLEGLATASAPPDALKPAIAALGGEVWIADPRGTLRAWKVTADKVEAVVIAKPTATRDPDGDAGGLSVAVAVGGGWLSTGDFYDQDPAGVPYTASAVNAPSVQIGGSADYDLGLLRVGAGVDAAMTLGKYHVALYGTGSTRFRTAPYAAVGVKYGQVTLGYAFPHHPMVGLRATVPLTEMLELRGTAWYGLGVARTRADGTDWQGDAMFAATAGIAGRFAL